MCDRHLGKSWYWQMFDGHLEKSWYCQMCDGHLENPGLLDGVMDIWANVGVWGVGKYNVRPFSPAAVVTEEIIKC